MTGKLPARGGGTAKHIRSFELDQVDWLNLGYAAQAARVRGDFVSAPPHVHFRELEHFDVLIDVLTRVQSFLGFDPAATNSLLTVG